ncbi:MAG: M23 family metallopeptidase [Candidatus Sedimenticola sp. (ex Thyasira tokunagai)]
MDIQPKKLTEFLFLLSLPFLLIGCQAFFPAPYGQVAMDSDPVRADNQPLYIPPNAPSTLNGFWDVENGHQGIDVLSDVGTPVLAPSPGLVTDSFFEPMYGNTIYIDHGRSDDGFYIRGRFVHLDERMVKVGDRVRRGQQIGALGRTGLLAGGIAHLHFEIQLATENKSHLFNPKNPHIYWMDGAGIVTCFDRETTYPEKPFRTTYPVPCLEAGER